MIRGARQSNHLVWFLAVVVAAPAACGQNTPTTPGVVIPPAAPTASNSVRYDLTVTAGLPCGKLDESLGQMADTKLPVQVQTRTYTADATPWTGGGLSIEVSGPALAAFGFGLIRESNRVQFMIDGPAFFEQLPNFSYLEISGAGEATIADLDSSEITIPFSGAFEYCTLNSARSSKNNCYTTLASQRISYSVCHSSSHRMTLTRR